MNLKLTSANYRNYLKILGILILMLSVTAYMIAPLQVQAFVSTHCHVTDGTFTHCSDGSTEWSDITPVPFNGMQSFLYADEAKFNPSLTGTVDTLFLMYDDVVRTSPLGPNEYVQVSFKTVENIGGGVNHLQHYTIYIYADGSFTFIENGVVKTNPDGATRYTELEDMRAAASFGVSPNSAVPHVLAEFQIGLTAAGAASYSPDPLFWSSGIPLLPDLKCYTINDVSPGQKVSLTDQFGIEQNVTVGNAIDLCVTAIKSLPGAPGQAPSFQLALKCYSITDSAPGVSVNIADQFGPENNVAVGQPDRLCGWVLINPSSGQVPQFKVDFKCYLITDTAPGKTVSLTDQFENESSVNVGAPDHLCVPVTKTLSSGQEFPPPTPLDRLHYKCYAISGQPTTKIVSLQDEFGLEQGVNVKGSDHLCLTASKTPVGPPPPPTSTKPPDLKCYELVGGTPPQKFVNLEDQFGVETNVTVGGPRLLCVTAIKSPPGTTPRFQMDWKCYDIQGTNASAVVNLQDQFGTESNLQVAKAFMLCNTVQLSTLKPASGGTVTTTPPVTLDFKCYSISDTSPGAIVNLTDVFHTETNVQVGSPFALCASATKTPPGTPPQINLDYKCYSISGAPVSQTVNMTDEFHTETNVLVYAPLALCEPAVKTLVPQRNPIPIQPPPDFKCHAITDSTPTFQIPTAVDQFGFEQNLIVQQPFMLCGLTTKILANGTKFQPPPGSNLDLKCYATTARPQNVTVDLADQFETETGVVVGPPFAVCVTAIKNGAASSTNINFKCYKIFGNQPPQVVTLDDQFGSEPNVRVGRGFALCTSVSFTPTAPTPVPWDLKCYTITGTAVNQKVTLSDQFFNETNVPVTNPLALCTSVKKTPHIPSPLGNPTAIPLNFATSAFLQAHDIGVTVTPESTQFSQQPSELSQLKMIIDFRCDSNATCRHDLATDLVNGEVSNGYISPSDASSFISTLSRVGTPTLPYIVPVALIAAVILGTIAFFKRKRLSTLTSSFFASILAVRSNNRRKKQI